ncbi:hypothetical protein Tco_0531134 [Tanacetum coccineum]
MFRKLELTIEARDDAAQARDIIKDNLYGLGQHIELFRRIQVKDIVKEVEDYLKTYSSAGMDISWQDKLIKLIGMTIRRVNWDFIRRSDTYAGNPVKEILLNLNLPDHRSVLMEPEGHVKMEMEIPRSSRSSATLILKRSSLKSLCVQDEAIQGR